MGTYRLFVCKNTLPLKWAFLNFLGSQFMVFANDWPIPAILVIPDDHEGYGVRSSENFICHFPIEGGTRGVKKVCFCYILANTSKKYSKKTCYVNYKENLNHFYGSYRREPETQYFSKKNTLFSYFNFLNHQPNF